MRPSSTQYLSKKGFFPGFSIIEMLLMLSIMSILFFISSAVMQSYILTAHRQDARFSLIKEQIRMEHCYQINHSYFKSCPDVDSFPHFSSQGHYVISLLNLSDASYTLHAKARAKQQKDKACLFFTINESSKKTATGPTCWLI